MTLLNYAYYANPTSHHDVLTKLRTFALAQGWTSDYYHSESVEWAATGGSPAYDFIGGAESALGLWSNGHGLQDLIVRFRCTQSGVDPQNETMYCAGIQPGTSRVPDGGQSAQPHAQTGYYTHSRYATHSMSPGTMHGVWFFGNAHFIYMVLAPDSSFCTFLLFGTPSLFKPTDKGVYLVTGGTYFDYYVYWYDAWGAQSKYALAHERTANTSYYNSWDANYDRRLPTWRNSTYVNATTVIYNTLYYAIQLNSWTGKRTMIQPMVYMMRYPDSVYYPLGTWPVFLIPFTGLGMGDILTYGAEQYMVFPDSFNVRQNGIAFRIV